MRDGPTTRSQTYPMRPAPPRESAPRTYDHEAGAYYEERRPRHDDFNSSRERFEEPVRNASRKYAEYERTPSKKTSERERPERTAKSAWTKATNIAMAGVKLNAAAKAKKEAERSRPAKETKLRERERERTEKTRTRHQYVESDDSDSDTATRVTSSTIKPSRPSPRHAPYSTSSRPSPTSRPSAYDDDDDSDVSDHSASRKWESHHDKTKAYIQKAAAGAGASRPKFERHDSGSYWTNHLRSGSDSDPRPTPTKSRRSYDEQPTRPSMPAQNSAPNNLKTRVEERSPKDRRSGPSASYSIRPEADHRKEMPSFQRSQTMPSPRPSRHDAAPPKSSNLKHAETHDSGYGSSSSPHTPDPMREDSPNRRGTNQRTRYQIVDPSSDDDRATRIHLMDDSDRRRRRQASPEPIEERRREKPQRPRVNTTSGHVRSKSSRDSPVDVPKMRRAESARYDDRSGRDSARDSPSSRYNSREKLWGEIDEAIEKEGSRYKYASGERTNPRSPHPESTFSPYPEQRSRDYASGSRFHSDMRGSRRSSVQAGVH